MRRELSEDIRFAFSLEAAALCERKHNANCWDNAVLLLRYLLSLHYNNIVVIQLDIQFPLILLPFGVFLSFSVLIRQ